MASSTTVALVVACTAMCMHVQYSNATQFGNQSNVFDRHIVIVGKNKSNDKEICSVVAFDNISVSVDSVSGIFSNVSMAQSTISCGEEEVSYVIHLSRGTANESGHVILHGQFQHHVNGTWNPGNLSVQYDSEVQVSLVKNWTNIGGDDSIQDGLCWSCSWVNLSSANCNVSMARLVAEPYVNGNISDIKDGVQCAADMAPTPGSYLVGRIVGAAIAAAAGLMLMAMAISCRKDQKHEYSTVNIND